MSEPTAVQLQAVVDLFLAGSRLPVAAMEMLIAGDERAENLLMGIVRSTVIRDESWAPIWAIVALGERRSARGLPDLLACIRQGTDLLHEAVEFALLRYGASAVPPTIQFLEENPGLDGRAHLYAALATSHDPRALEFLVARLRLDEECILSIAWALAETRDPKAIVAIARAVEWLGAREPELKDALEAARGTSDLTNPLFADWRTHWAFEEGEAETADAEQEPETLNEDETGLNLQPRYYDIHCPVCESQLEYDSKEDQARILRGGRYRPS